MAVIDPHDLLVEAVRSATGEAPTEFHPVGGGDFAASFAATLADRRRVFVKTHADPPPGFFTTEAAGLRWLREPEALSVPTVLGVSDGEPGVLAHLVLEWIEPGSRRAGTEAAFGRGLAALHHAGASCFGRTDRRTTGSLALPNDPCSTWAEFYGERRLGPLARLAGERGSLPPPVIARIDALASRLDRFDDGSAPSRLHGDLWAGNRVVAADGGSWLIDPAAHGGHREFDLAMMALFGGFGLECWQAYEEVTPLAEGWQERVGLHQLAPLIVHAVKFGGSYVRRVTEVVDQFV